MESRSQKARRIPSALTRSGVSLALAICLLAPSLPVFAAEDDEAALARAEKILFGNESHDDDFDDRLERVEKRIFGRKKNGSDEERVERVISTLLIDRKKLKGTKKAEDKPAAEEAAKPAEKPAEPVVQSQPDPFKSEAEPVANQPAEPAATTQTEPVAQAKPEPAMQATEATAQPVAQPAPPEAKKSTTKSKVAVQRGRKAGKAENKAAAAKKPEVTLTSETAALDVRKVEKHPSALEAPVTHSAASSNRISRHPTAASSKATELLREGMEAHRKGEDAKAEQLFKRVVLLEPRNPDGYFNLGALAEKKNDLAGALMSYRAALHLSPNDRELKEAVDSVESQLGVETTGSSHVAAGSSAPSERETEEARRAEIREYYGRSNDRSDVRHEAVAREQSFESSDRFQDQPGAYGFGASAHNGPRPAPNFYRARAKTTREIQEEAAPFVDVTDPDAPQMTVSQPQAPVANTSQPFQLHSQRNQVNQQANQNRRPSAAGTATRAILGVALSVGTNYALRSAGLHCPVCRIGGGAGPLRYLLRF